MLKKLGDFFKSLLVWFKSPEFQHRLDEINNLVPTILPIVRAVSLATKNKTDDEILDYADSVLVSPVNSATQDILRAVARTLVQKELPGLSDSIVNSAIELALQAIKSGA